VNPLVLVVDDEPDVEVLFRQQFRRDLRTDRFTMEFAQSAPAALQHITDAGDRSLILILSDVNMPGMSSRLQAGNHITYTSFKKPTSHFYAMTPMLGLPWRLPCRIHSGITHRRTRISILTLLHLLAF